MRARSLLAGAVAASIVALPGLAATPAQADQGWGCLLPCGGSLSLTAPASIGVGGDWARITLRQADADGSFSAPIVVQLTGDVALESDNVVAQVQVGPTWTNLSLTEDGGELRGQTPAMSIGQGATDIHFRIAVDGDQFNPFDEDDNLDELTFGAEYLPLPPPPPPLNKPRQEPRALVGPDGVSKTMAVRGLAISTTPTSGKATLGKSFAASVTIRNDSASAYENVVALPVLPGAQSTPLLRRPLARLKALAADTETTVEFKKNGRWVDLFSTTGPNDAPLVDLAAGAGKTVQWRFTFRDPELLGETRIGWMAGRFAPPADEVEDQAQLVPADASVVLAGWGVTGLTIVKAVVPPKAPPKADPGSDDGAGTGSGTGTGDDDGAGEGGAAAPVRGTLASTGYDLAGTTRTGVLLLAFGLVAVGLTRRRSTR